jgi:hypothetical protein
MFKSIAVTVPAGTQPDAPIQTSVKLCDGTIRTVTIRPAIGPQWELYAKIVYREVSIIPFEETEWIPLEQYPVESHLNWDRWDGTYTIDILACSPQARFEHTFVVDIEVEEGFTEVQAIMDLISRGL